VKALSAMVGFLISSCRLGVGMRGACSILSSSSSNLVLSGIGLLVNSAIPFSKGTFL